MKPLHERTEDILNKRNEYLDMRRQQVYDAEVCKECTFTPRLHPKSVGLHARDLRSLYRWDNKRAHKINQTLNRQLEAEAANCPFSPELSAASRRIAEEYSNANVHERLVHDANRRRIDFHEEQSVQKSLKPHAYAAETPSPKKVTFDVKASPSKPRRPQSASP